MPKQRTLEELQKDYVYFCIKLESEGFKVEEQNALEKMLDISCYSDPIYERIEKLKEFIKNKVTSTTKIKGNNIFGYIIIDLNIKNPSFDNWKYSARIYTDHKKSFNKIYQCPFQMMLPRENKFDAYLKRIKFWGTKEGYKKSNFYKSHDWDNDII